MHSTPPVMREEEDIVFPGALFTMHQEADVKFHDPFDLYTSFILDSVGNATGSVQ